MANAPSYAAVPLAPDIVQIATASTTRDGSGTSGATSASQLVILTAGDTNGVVIEQVKIMATGNTTAGMIRFYLSKDGGTSKRLLCEVPVTQASPSATQQAFTKVVDDLAGLTLKDATTILYVATHNAETFNIFNHKAGL